ncbi:hypothetical protein [Pseudomonas sp. ICMP 19500]|nr:hypothetical protein [Pseudomonas sp. ICMP 19500]
MKQMTFADAEYAGKRKQTRKELFLIEMETPSTPVSANKPAKSCS